MSSIEIRTVRPDEQRSWLLAEQRSFGIEPDDERLDQIMPAIEHQRSVAAIDRGDIVATGGAFSTTITVPGGAQLPVGGITAIGTRPTHTRQGLFRGVMGLLHEQSVDRDEVGTVLLASEAHLYPRFGYGMATAAAMVRLDPRRVRFRTDAADRDRLRTHVDVATAGEVLHDIWDRAGADRPGWLRRPRQLLDLTLADHPADRDGAMAYTLLLHHDEAGRPDGYCLFRRTPGFEQWESKGTLHIDELVAPDPGVRLALWRHCLEVDLVETVTAHCVPVDDPLPWALEDRRRYRVTSLIDQVWLRLHDPSRALAARTYRTTDRITVAVENVGTFAVEGGPDGAECRPVDGEADVACSIDGLGSLVVGHPIRPLVTAGRAIVGDGDIDRIDRFFAAAQTPFSLLDF